MRNEITGDPVVGASVILVGPDSSTQYREVATGAISGRFSFSEIEDYGSYYLIISKDGYETKQSETFTIKVGEKICLGNFTLTPTSLPSIPILNSPDTSDLNNVCFSWSGSTCTDCGHISYNLEIYDDQGNSIFKADRDNGQLIPFEYYPTPGDTPVHLDPDRTYYWTVFPVGENGLWNLDVGSWPSFSTGSSTCSLSIIPQNYYFASAGGTGAISITTPMSCGWTAVSQAGWITVTSAPTGSGNGTITYSVATNDSISSRSGTVQVGAQFFSITQAASACDYSLSNYTNSFDYTGGTGDITITANTGCEWMTVSDASWIVITSLPSGSGNDTLTYGIDAFADSGSRIGNIIVEGKVFTITQTGVLCTYSLSKSSDTFSINGDIQSVDIITPGGCSWTAAASDSWLEINKTGGTGPDSITYVVRDYDGADARAATLTVEGQTLSVTQAGVGCGGAGSSLSPQSATYSANGGTGVVNVSAASDCTWSVTTEGWITIAPGDDIGTGNDVVNYTVQANPTNDIRIGHLSIAQQLFTITQEGIALGIPDNLRVFEQFTNSFKLSWDYVANATGYTLQKATDSGFTQNLETFTINTTNTSPSKLISTDFGSYYFRIQAFNISVSSDWSVILPFTWYSDITPSITDDMLWPADDTELSSNSVNLSWSASGGNGTLLYSVYFSDWAPTELDAIVENSPATDFTKSGLSFNKTYYWKIKVVDEDGDEDWTNTVQFTILPESNPPSGSISVDNGDASTNSVSVTLFLLATDAEGEIAQMQFSNDGANWASWVAYNEIYPSWNLGDFGGTTNPGMKTVYARFKDNSGNISGINSDDITLEEGTPGNIILNGQHYASLRRAIDDAVPGETIYITAGWYDLTVEVNSSVYFDQSPGTYIGCALKDGVNLKGEGAEKTTLYWDDGTYGLVVNDSNIVEGLRLIRPTYPTHSRYAVMFAGSNSTIRDCIITNSDKALSVYAGSVNNYSNISISNCVISNNQGYNILDYIDNLTFVNNVLYNNDSPALAVYNITGNIRNNIVTNNQGGVSISNGPGINFTHNNVWNNIYYNYDDGTEVLPIQTGINGNISADPNFVDTLNANFMLSTGSPCINAGTDVDLPYIGLPDMGAFEYNAPGSLTITANVSADFLITMPDGSSQTVTAPWTATGLAIGIYGVFPQEYTGYYKPDMDFVTLKAGEDFTLNLVYTADSDGPTGELLVNGGNYFTQSRYVTLVNDVNDPVFGISSSSQMQFSNDGINWSTPEPISNKKLNWDLASFGGSTIDGIKAIYARYSDDGGNWSNTMIDEIKYIPSGRTLVVPDVFGTLHEAVAEAQEGDIIYVRDGVHQLWEDLFIPSGVRIQGSSKETTHIRPRFTHVPSNVTIDNITWLNAPEIRLEGSQNQIISNAVFDSSAYVIVYANDVRAEIRNSIFKESGSTASYVYNSYGRNCNLKITNSVFDGSVNTSSGGTFTYGGIRFNLDNYAGNVFPAFYNNIFYGFDNTSSTAIVVHNDNEDPGDIYIKNNNFFNSTDDLDASGVPITQPLYSTWIDPQFVDMQGYKLSDTSLLINAGKPDLLYNNHDGSTNTIGIEGGPFYNTPPSPIAEAVPSHGGLNTIITFDASASIDEQTPTTNLLVRWDFNGDGHFDTGYLTDLTIQYQFTDYSDDSIICWIYDEHFAIARVEIPNPTVYADSDNDGIPDRVEDANLNGIVDPGETDPYSADTDGDGIWDGVELGYTLADIGPGTDTSVFSPDNDPATTTLPLDPDTDGDGVIDGDEDTNHNGMLDTGENDPVDYIVIINSITPASGCMGTQVTISGLNFGDGGQTIRHIEFNINVFTNEIVSWSNTEIVCMVPSGVDSGCVRVITDDGKSNCIDFLYEQTKADFSAASTAGNFPLEVTFTDLSVCRINSWNWDFGDGTTSSDLNPTHVYTTAGEYTVRLTVAGGEGIETMTKTAYIQVFEPILSVTPAIQNIASSGGSLEYLVENSGTGIMPWTASKDADWITIDSGASGTDSGAITLSILENSGDGRSGYITVTAIGATGSPMVVEVQQDAGAGAGVFKIFSEDGTEYDGFGYSVATDEDRLIVGAPFEEYNGYNSGSAYVFAKTGNNWVQQGKLNASDEESDDSYGWSVGISGDYAIVGSICDDDGGGCSGSAYIFHYDGANWVEAFKLTASDANANDRFGGSVAISGDRVIVGAYGNDDLGYSSGSAYIYHRNGAVWEQQPILLPDDGAAGDRFGQSVSISGDVAVVGAILDDDYGENSGSAYVFHWNGNSWIQVQKLTTEEAGSDHDYFGKAVSVSGDYILVGVESSNEGAAYVYHYSGIDWIRQAKLTNDDGNTGDLFGAAVSITENYAIVGAQFDNENGSYAGASYIFKRELDTWSRQPKIVPADAISSHNFGHSTAISNGSAFVGAYGDDDLGTGAGAVYAYDLSLFEPQPAVAEFSADPIAGHYPLDVAFTDNSTGDIDSWLWEFGDGNTSTEQNPLHAYESTGSYTVSLTVTGPVGSANITKSDYITVTHIAPGASFTSAAQSGIAPLSVTFTDQSSGMIDSWYWEFGDGGTSTDQNPIHSYNQPGVYTVSLMVMGPGGSDIIEKINYINVLYPVPAIAFSALETSGSAPFEVTFTDESSGTITSWLWDFGDFNSSSYQNPSHTYSAAGNYTVSLTIAGPGGSDTEIKTDYVTVLDADFDEDGLSDVLESTMCTDVNDADTDDDGIIDGNEDTNHDGEVGLNETDPCLADTDGDGIYDGTEIGLVEPENISATDLFSGFFIADANPASQTDPTKADTDGDGIDDGLEDVNHNGDIDPCEPDPSTKTTDISIDMDNDGDVDGIDLATYIQALESGTAEVCFDVFSAYMGKSTLPADPDNDGILSDGDYSGISGDFPCPDGLAYDCDDNCPNIFNPDQTDSDENGIGDACEETGPIVIFSDDFNDNYIAPEKWSTSRYTVI